MVLRARAGSFKWALLNPLFKFATAVVASDLMVGDQGWGRKDQKALRDRLIAWGSFLVMWESLSTGEKSW